MKRNRILSLMKSGKFLSYTLGRFYSVRKIYSLWQGLLNPHQLKSVDSDIFPSVDANAAVASLRRDAVAFGFDLSAEQVQEIHEFALSSRCSSTGTDQEFCFNDLEDGRLGDGTPVALAQVKDVLNCSAIKAITEDSRLHEVACRYLGYEVKQKDVRLFWSPCSSLSDDERRRLSQTIDFHIDIYSFNFCYAHFYILDTDKTNGAHEMVLGSHRKKKLPWLFGSARKTETELRRFYSSENFRMIEAKAGSGFLEDTSCYHRAMVPENSARLLLQIRMY